MTKQQLKEMLEDLPISDNFRMLVIFADTKKIYSSLNDELNERIRHILDNNVGSHYEEVR